MCQGKVWANSTQVEETARKKPRCRSMASPKNRGSLVGHVGSYRNMF